MVGCDADFMGLVPLPCWPMHRDPGPLARFLLVCLGVHRSLSALVCVYAATAWLRFGPLLCVRPAPSADPWAPIPHCAICGALGASVQWLARTPSRLTSCCARALLWPARLLRNSVAWHASNSWARFHGLLLPEHKEFDAWCADQARPVPVGPNIPPVSMEPSAQAIPPPRANKRHASHSDPTKVKRSRPSSFVSRIPPVPSARMSSTNNSSAETARQSRREK
ncbi:hypothetical protein V6N12_009443 [Hibiscus sabdariffa]|uniref:Uncharacterized protein n=1 Tax=Hibiscus sabdariffa TaxID=183260 RepID=A0ABR2E957_9ROSI